MKSTGINDPQLLLYLHINNLIKSGRILLFLNLLLKLHNAEVLCFTDMLNNLIWIVFIMLVLDIDAILM